MPFWLLRELHLDSARALLVSTKLVQAAVAAVADISVWGIALSLGSPERARSVAAWTLVCQLTCWFNAYALVRTYSNSMEAPICAAAILFWLRACRSTTAVAQVGWLLLAALGFAFRPHSGLFWVLPGVIRLLQLKSGWERCKLIGLTFIIGVTTLSFTAIVDYFGYGR